MPDLANLIAIPTDELTRLHAVLDRFAAALRQDPAADLTPFLPDRGHPHLRTYLVELARAAVWARGQTGDGRAVEGLLAAHPDLRAAAADRLALVWEEYLARRRHGPPDPAEYRARFPDLFDRLQERIAAASSVEMPGPDAGSGTLTQFPPAPPVAPPADRVLAVGGGYRLRRRIGSGSFGEVWLAEAPGGIDVAVKIISRPLDHEEAKRELQALELIKQLRHPFLVSTQAFWPLDDRLVIVMELADGSLAEHLARRPAGLPVETLLPWLREACDAIDFLHRKRVIHRDLKPANILVFGDHVKVADFGLARARQANPTVQATLSGTPGYMAPELWAGGPATPASDLYALAATYVELRLGRRLFGVAGLLQIMASHVEAEPDLTGMTPEEDAAVRRALAKDARARHATCLDFWRDLDRALAAVPVATAVEPEAVEPGPRTARRTGRRVAALVLAAFVSVTAVAAWVATRPTPQAVTDYVASARPTATEGPMPRVVAADNPVIDPVPEKPEPPTRPADARSPRKSVASVPPVAIPVGVEYEPGKPITMDWLAGLPPGSPLDSAFWVGPSRFPLLRRPGAPTAEPSAAKAPGFLDRVTPFTTRQAPGGEFVLLTTGQLWENDFKVLGWAPSHLVLQRIYAMRDPRTRLERRVIVAAAVTGLREKADLAATPFRSGPSADAPSLGSLPRTGGTYYVYADSAPTSPDRGFLLLGTLQRNLDEPPPADVVKGWVEKGQLLVWSGREAVRWDPAAVGPIKAYATLDDVLRALRGDQVKPVAEFDPSKGDDEWPPNRMRFPLLPIDPTGPDPTDIRRVVGVNSVYRVAVIGTLTAEGDRPTATFPSPELRALLERHKVPLADFRDKPSYRPCFVAERTADGRSQLRREILVHGDELTMLLVNLQLGFAAEELDRLKRVDVVADLKRMKEDWLRPYEAVADFASPLLRMSADEVSDEKRLPDAELRTHLLTLKKKYRLLDDVLHKERWEYAADPSLGTDPLKLRRIGKAMPADRRFATGRWNEELYWLDRAREWP